MARFGLATLVLLLGTTAGTAPPPPPAEDEVLRQIRLVGEAPATGQTVRHLVEADKLVAEQKWAEAADAYQHILTEAGDDLVPLDRRHSIQARHLCQSRVASLPPTALRPYRAQVDSQAKKWLAQGKATHDTTVLRRLVEDSFCSSSTDQALDLLGDLAFERGDFEEAQRWWRMLARPATELNVQSSKLKVRDVEHSTLNLQLVFPDPQIEVARVRAKQILARLFRGDRSGAVEEWRAFQTLHPQAEGQIAGKKGTYAAILQSLIVQADTLAAPRAEEAWATFAGDPSRSGILPTARGRLAKLPQLEAPQWAVRLATGERISTTRKTPANGGEVPPPSQAARRLASYPVIAGKQVLLADASSVTAYDLLSGQQLWREDLWANQEKGGLKLPAGPDLSFTLTVAGDHVYARLLGPPPPMDDKVRELYSYLVCFRLQPEANESRTLWTVPSKGGLGSGPVFEGAPMVDHGRVYIVESRFPPGQTQTAIACYDADSGASRWKTDVCETPLLKGGEQRSRDQLLNGGEQRSRDQLLTLAGSNVVYCSHSGAIVAVDALTGRRVWGVRYPSRGILTEQGRLSPRSLCPCLYASGRLYAAPLDFDRILCLDADTGMLIWESTPLEVIHLLGAAQGRLIFTTITPDPSIRALEAAIGKPLRSWMYPDDGTKLYTLGRGLLAGEWVFWPTETGLRVLTQHEGELDSNFSENIRGNLAAANGCLVVADAEQLSAYLAEGLLLERRRQEASEQKTSAAARYRLARAEADAGMESQALEDFARAESLASGGVRLHGQPLPELARRDRHELLLELARRAQNAEQTERAAMFLEQAAAKEFPSAARLQALARLGALWTSRDEPGHAAAVWQRILEDETLRHGQVLNVEGALQLATVAASDRIAALGRAHGPHIYEPIEQRARALLASGQGEKEVLARLGHEFPNATVTGPALLELARLSEQAGQAGAAAEAYRAFLLRGGAGSERPLALAGLARAYERQHCWAAARRCWEELAAEQGNHVLASLHPDLAVREWVAQQLQQPAYRAAGPPAPAELLLPLVRAWHAAPAGEEPRNQVLKPREQHCLLVENEYLLTVREKTLTCREAVSGNECWARLLSFAPTWIGSHADMVLVGGADGVESLRRADGAPIWSLLPARSASEGRATPSVALRAGRAGRAGMSAFQLAGGRLHLLEDERQLLALDAERGRVLWCWPGAMPCAMLSRPRLVATNTAPGGRESMPPGSRPGGQLFPHFYAGDEKVVVQTGNGKRCVLDGRTGRTLHETDTSKEPWPQAPLAHDGHRIFLVPDPQHIVLFDTATGKDIWTHALEPSASLTGKAPQLLANPRTLLVLVERNHGYFLECLEPQTGVRRWPDALFLGVKPVNLEAGAVNESAFYFVQDSTLHARELADGKPLWESPLPGQPGCWRIVRTANHLVLFPRATQAMQWRWRWLFCDVQFGMTVGQDPYYPVLLYDQKTGQLVQRLNFPAAKPRMPIQQAFDCVPVPVPQLQTRRWSVEDDASAVQCFERGMTVVLEGEAWGLSGAKRD